MAQKKILSDIWPVVIVANTLPVKQVEKHGKVNWEMSPGGLVSALTPLVEKRGGAWIGWARTPGVAPRPFMLGKIANVPVPISAEEVEEFYEGVCNRTIWPLYHDVLRQPEYHRHWWAHYVTVNERFAQIAARTAKQGGAVWIHDYQLQLVPAMIRERRKDVRIGFFLHIPFPPEELFSRMPWRRQVLEGLLGADVIGFQTPADARNFKRLARRYTEAQEKKSRLHYHGRTVRAEAYPISIDSDKYESTAKLQTVVQRTEQLRTSVGHGRKIILGVDRLDYTKGIEVRVKAFGELLASGQRNIRDVVYIQVAVPSRERVSDYQELRGTVEELVGQVNGNFGEVGFTPMQYLRRNFQIEELVALYRAADVMLVTPFADGMNLVAKEYVATRYDNTGVLVLSEFAGAAPELRSALLVNPHDVDGLAETMHRALTLPVKEARRRMRAMRRIVSQYTVHDWAHSFMTVLMGG
jgi:trehalose 6-phosphate synthase